MNAPFLQRLLLAVYPKSFRDRYGEELATVAADCGGGWRVAADLAVSGVKARMSCDPIMSGPGGRRLRLEATTGTVFGLWVWSTVAVGLFARAVDDQPVPGLRSWGWSAYEVGNVIFSVSAAVFLAAGFVYWLLVVVPAVRTRRRAILVPAALPVAVVAIWLAGTGVVSVMTHHVAPSDYRHATAQGPHTVGGWVLLSSYALFTLVCVTVCTIAIRRALKMAELTPPMVSVSGVIAAVATVALAAVTVCAVICITRVLMVAGIDARDELTALAAVGFLLLASVAAMTSSLRGLMAIRIRRIK